ncbi:hypothetical protein LUZ61_018483 [Rhynchospora tenuis]|uniref:Beta-amylase n=1 Tax=Rhynchospora tenuis TaxID=198213 RepID=A0AAD5Z9A8_9POAL|nr:hypothetical protein LUZ61_018483 [Rhynchospora tenuis]
MALRVTAPLFVVQYVQAGRPNTTSTSAPVTSHSVSPLLCISRPRSFRSLDHRAKRIDGRLHGGFPPRAGPITTSPLWFDTSGTNDTNQEQPSFSKGSIDPGENGKVTKKAAPNLPDCYFLGTPYIPVYVKLPRLRSVGVDGVMVDCCWGIVEANQPLEYNWSGYKRLFDIIKHTELKVQVMMSFHECRDNTSGTDITIPLPNWVTKIGEANPDIYFTGRDGRRNTECLTWGIDKERVLLGRTALEVYFDFMRSFRVEMDEFFKEGVISNIEVGLGPCGELRYPSYPTEQGWIYPGIDEFQCYDQYLLKSLRNAAKGKSNSFWKKGSANAGTYNSRPQDTGFFHDGGNCNGYYWKFFLKWCSNVLVDHADHVIMLAKLAFEGSSIVAKVLNEAWDASIPVMSENALPCFDRDGFNKILEYVKPYNDPIGRHLLSFTYLKLSPPLHQIKSLYELRQFIQKMHGETLSPHFSISCLISFWIVLYLYRFLER